MEGRRETLLSAGCSLLLLILAAATAVGSESPPCRLEDCPHFSAIRYHEELGCVRNDGTTGCCPTSYNCSSLLSLEKTKCHYRGEAYELGAVIEEEIKSLCIPQCWCEGDDEWGDAKFNCAHMNCQVLIEPGPLKPGCFRTYSVDQCCSTGVHCVNATGGGQVVECVYNGKTYLEGQYIDVHENDCRTCVCQAGFNGTLDGPWCRKFSCDYLLGYSPSGLASCAPAFVNTSTCCSLGWHCPSADDIIIRHSEPPTENEQHCKFGDHRLKIGDELQAYEIPCIICTCNVPPFITCEEFPVSQCVAQTK